MPTQLQRQHLQLAQASLVNHPAQVVRQCVVAVGLARLSTAGQQSKDLLLDSEIAQKLWSYSSKSRIVWRAPTRRRARVAYIAAHGRKLEDVFAFIHGHLCLSDVAPVFAWDRFAVRMQVLS